MTHGSYNSQFIKLNGPSRKAPTPAKMKNRINKNQTMEVSTPESAQEKVGNIQRLFSCDKIIIQRNSITHKVPEIPENKNNIEDVRRTDVESNPVVANFRQFLDSLPRNENPKLRFPALEALLCFNPDSPQSIFQFSSELKN